MASFLSVLRAGPPPPKVVLLPDALFFTRSIPITAGATDADAAAQVELALEAISPFPLAQLYYGSYWVPGTERAFVYAAYRRRFTTDQIATWADAELVIPTSVAFFGAEVKPATTMILTTDEGLTAVHWESLLVPSRVLFRPVQPEATDDERGAVRDELLRVMGGSKTVMDLFGLPAADSLKRDREIEFRSGDLVSRVTAARSGTLDVRDKTELAAFWQGRQRDVVLWRITLGCAAALVLLGLSQLGLIGGNMWQKTRIAQLNRDKPQVDQIKASEELATRIDDLVNKRLLPLEMLTSLVGVDSEHKRKPDEITIVKVETDKKNGLYTISIEVQTNNAGLINVYQSQLKELPECEDVKVVPRGTTSRGVGFGLVVTFKPGVLKPTPSA